MDQDLEPDTQWQELKVEMMVMLQSRREMSGNWTNAVAGDLDQKRRTERQVESRVDIQGEGVGDLRSLKRWRWQDDIHQQATQEKTGVGVEQVELYEP